MGKAMEGRRSYSLAILVLCLAGCGRFSSPPYPDWSTRTSEYVPQTGTSNAFDKYALAALSAESSGTKYLDRVYFTPDRKRNALQAINNAIAMVAQGTKLRCNFEFTPTAPSEAPRYQKGWRLIGRGLVWRIDEAIERSDYNKAIYYAVTATKFGFDLTGGGATDAALGLTIVDEARQAIAPALGRLNHSQLKKIGNGMAASLKNKPDIEVAIGNEERNMMAAVQFIQDCYRLQKTRDLNDLLGTWARPAVKYLVQLQQKDTTERPKYFQGLANDAKIEIDWCSRQAKVAASQRETEPKFAEERPWKRFSRSFFYTLRPLIAMNDVTVARTRLFILEAYLQVSVRLGRAAPRSLSAYSTALTTDPFSGKQFIYRADGLDFDIYSVGKDFQDDGGETDESNTAPDLRAETQLR
jgi:hypothetical protein